MKISERQLQKMLFYLNIFLTLDYLGESKINLAKLIDEINSQQSDKLIEIEDL